MKKALIIIFTFISLTTFGQFSEKISTDTSDIEIIRNSVYKVFEERYKNKDSVFYSVRYIEDTSIINIEGWKRKNGDYFGNWTEYSAEGTWLYTINYDKDTWQYNKKEYPYQNLLNSMKHFADNIIIQKYGLAFFKNNVRFKFHGFTEICTLEVKETGTFWEREKYTGSWLEPIKEKPNTFTFDYTIRLDNKHFYYDMLRITVDSLGNLIDKPDKYEVMFQERKVLKADKFSLTYQKALEICRKNGLKAEKQQDIEARLRYGFRKKDSNAGEYYFEIAQKYDEKWEGDCKKQCFQTKYYNVWRINPWTSEVFFNKKQKRVTSWTPGCGVGGGYENIE